MLMSDNVSCLLQTPKIPSISTLKVDPDPNYFFDLKEHLQQKEGYRQERKQFYKLHPSWSIFKARDEFAKEYSETFHTDIKYFVMANPGLSPEEAAQIFCNKWRGYGNMYGEEFVRRAITRLSR